MTPSNIHHTSMPTPMIHKLLLPVLLVAATGWLHAAPTTRATDFTAALEQSKATGNDIVVLQRGSDWNALGETIYQSVWLKPEFTAALGDGFVLVAVDRPEQPGAPAIGSGESPAAIKRFMTATAAGSSLPANQITAIHAAGGGTFKKRTDGSWLIDDPKGGTKPPKGILESTVQAREGGQLVRLDFLPDIILPNACAGRASNGNFAISEIEITRAGKPVAASQCWGDYFEAGMPPAQLIDGIKDSPNNGWNAAAHHRQRRTLILTLPESVRPGTALKVSLICQAQWAQHVPACMRAAVIDDAPLSEAITRVVEAQALAAANATFTWWDAGRCPRVALVDAAGRAIAAEDSPRLDLTPGSLAARIRAMHDKRINRDELLAAADKAQGADQAELLRQALAVLGFANWPGNGNCYQPIHERIRKVDPQDASGATRWLGFSSDPKGGVPWAKPAWNEAIDTQGGKRTLADADYQEALSRVDKELADPRNKVLSHENIQRMMVAKFHIFKAWKGHEDERFRIQQEIAAFDPTTFWGIGANGYLGMYGRSETPYLTYGWKPNQVKAGINVWRMTDTGYYFDHPGHYKVTLTHAGGASTVRIKRLAMLDGESVLAEAAPDAEFGPASNARVVAFMDCAGWQSGKSYRLLAEIDARDGQTDNAGTFTIEPWIVAPTADKPAPAPFYFKTLLSLRDKLSAALSPHRDALAKPLAADATRLDLAHYELLRRCGPEAIEQLAVRPGGSEFLKSLTSDLAWMESFLANDNAPWPQAIGNLGFLCANATTEAANPLNRRIATAIAIALAAGDMNRYRLLDRYLAIIRTHRTGLMHASFDSLDVREMRWAVLLSGTAVDYESMVDATQVRLGDYLGTCWGIAYIDPNVYGYSVQGWGYADPWTHHYGTGTGDRPFRAQRLVGGVCGTLSGFGAATARAHGVMSTTVGQPGHCAYVVRIGQEWPTGYDVSGPETNGASVYEGTGFATMHRLYEPVHADKASFINSSRLSWAAHLFLDRRGAMVHLLPGLKFSTYQLPGGQLDALSKLKPVTTGTATGFDLAAVTPADPNNFGVVWEGEIEVLGDGPVAVDLKSDDASRLIVGGQTVSCNQGPIPLKIRPGVHPVRLEYGQAGGALSLAVDWPSPPVWNADWIGAYQQAIAAHPIHYPLVLEYIKSLEAVPDVPAGVWRKLIGDIATAYAPYHEAAWALVNRCYARLSPSLKPEERMTLLLQCHQRINQANAPGYMGYNIGGVLNSQAESLGDPAMAVTFMQNLLEIDFSQETTINRVFSDVLNWGRARIAEHVATSAA